MYCGTYEISVLVRVHWSWYSVVEYASKSATKKYGIGEIRIVVNFRLVSSSSEVRLSWTIGSGIAVGFYEVPGSEDILQVTVLQVTSMKRLFRIIYSFFTYIKISAKTKGVCWRMYFKALVGIICEYIVNYYMGIITSERVQVVRRSREERKKPLVMERLFIIMT